MTAPPAPTGPFQITVQPSGRQFSVDSGEAILPAAIRQGVGMPYGCKDGACGSCKCKKLEGVVVHGVHQTKALSPEVRLIVTFWNSKPLQGRAAKRGARRRLLHRPGAVRRLRDQPEHRRRPVRPHG